MFILNFIGYMIILPHMIQINVKTSEMVWYYLTNSTVAI